MKLKQKIVLMVMISGLALGFSAVVPSGDVSAQAGIDCPPEGCPMERPPEFQEEEEKCEGPDCCGGEAGVKTSIITGDLFCGNEDGTPENSTIFRLLKGLLRIMTFGVGVAAVGGIAWGALLYTTAENKPEQTKKAISVITNVAIGIAAYAAMYVLLNFLIPGGVFS